MGAFNFNIFKQFPKVTTGVSTDTHSNLSYKWSDRPLEVRENRQSFFKELGVNESQVAATQVIGGKDFHDVNEQDRGRGIDKPEEGLVGDGFFTSKPDTYLFILVGDCLALFLYEPVKKVCGLVHAGYLGVDQQLPKLAVHHMVKKYGCDPKEIRAAFSPALQKESTVLENFDKFNQETINRWQPYIKESGGKYTIDWLQYAQDQLIELGVPDHQVERCPINTRFDDRFYSHRRSKEESLPEARFGCLIGFQS